MLSDSIHVPCLRWTKFETHCPFPSLLGQKPACCWMDAMHYALIVRYTLGSIKRVSGLHLCIMQETARYLDSRQLAWDIVYGIEKWCILTNCYLQCDRNIYINESSRSVKIPTIWYSMLFPCLAHCNWPLAPCICSASSRRTSPISQVPTVPWSEELEKLSPQAGFFPPSNHHAR